MGILENFRRKIPKRARDKEEKSRGRGKTKEPNVLDMVKEDSGRPKSEKPKVSKEATGEAHWVLARPQLSEKANMLAAAGKYVFRVHPKANKPQIQKAVEAVYDVHVRSVNIINITGKTRRYGRSLGRTKQWKKAIVTVAEGEKIEGITETV